MYDAIRFLPLVLVFLVFPLCAFACRKMLGTQYRAPALAILGLLLLPLLSILGADDGVRIHDLGPFLRMALLVVGSYALIFLIHWMLVYRWGTSEGIAGLVAIVFPLAVLAAAKYTPGNWGQFYHGKRFSELYLGLSYVAFRLGFLALEVRTQVVSRPTLAQYMGFTFFPLTLSVGPISTYSHFERSLTQDIRTPPFAAFLRFAKGATKYLLLANLVNQLTYAGLLRDGHPHGRVDVIVAIIAYYLYLYLNFSGYCDMVIAAGALCGFEIQENFDSPFSARNLQEFWKRWHITLSTYLRDLMFTPLSKSLARINEGKNVQHAVAISIFSVFLVIGVWHGVGWNFALYGAAHGAGVVTVHYYGQFLKRALSRKAYQAYLANPLIKAAARAATQGFAAFSLILFANPLPEVLHLLKSLAGGRYVH